MPKKQLRLGAILTGVGTSQNGWRDPALPGNASIDIDWYRTVAQQAEAAKLDLVFIVRGHLGLPVPPNRYGAQRAAAARASSEGVAALAHD